MLIDKFRECRTYCHRNLSDFFLDPSKVTAGAFIEKYYSSRGKGSLFAIEWNDKNSMMDKSVHMVSAFLLGFYLKNIAESKIKRVISEKAPITGDSFEYPWFLCCLYHDAFSQFESAHREKSWDTIEEFVETENIEHTIYDRNFDNIEIPDFTPTYHKETVQEYYTYRKKDGKKDHGILSGYMVFDRLSKNYLRNREKHDTDGFETQQNGHTLIWDKKQLWIFAMVADAIIAHNIWHQDASDKLPKEITKGAPEERKLSLSSTPLAYFLAIIDTIEPVKYFQGVRPTKIWNHLSITRKRNTITIEQSDCKIFDLEKWFVDKMKSMTDWIEIESVEYDSEKDKICIVLKKSLDNTAKVKE